MKAMKVLARVCGALLIVILPWFLALTSLFPLITPAFLCGLTVNVVANWGIPCS